MRQACLVGNSAPGAAWINGSVKYSTTDYIQADSAKKTGTITAYMHGAIYNLSAGGAYARNIQLCEADWSGTHLGSWGSNPCDGHNRPSWITGNADGFDRGYSEGWGWTYCPTWMDNGNCGGYVNIDVAKFIASTKSTTSSGGYTTYTNYVWFARCANQYGQCGWWSGWTYAADKITVKIRIKTEEVKKVSVSPSASLSGTAYIGETAPTPSFFYSDSATISSGGTTSTGSIDNMNKKLETLRITKETKEVAFYVANYHNGTDGSSPGVGNSRLGGKTYSGDNVVSWACRQFGAAVGRCYDNNTEGARKIDDAEYLVGYKFCVAAVARVGVQENGVTTWNDWQVSGASCIPIYKKANVGIAGNNIYASNGVKTSVSRKWSGKVFGSWAEFLIATGTAGISGNNTNIGTSSGNALYNGLSSSATQKKNWSSESVGNKSMSGQNVPAAQISASSNFVNQVKKLVDSGSNSSVEIIRTNSITASIRNNQATQKQIIVYSDGDLTISNNVRYIDAWIIAPNGIVDTCAEGKVTGEIDSSMDTTTCNNPLTINGLVYAKGLKLDRTYGGTTNELAEIINLTPASYVWAYNQATSTYANPTTVYVRELAPRV